MDEKTLTNWLVQDLEGLLKSGDSSDAMIRVKGQEFPIHKAIICARCPALLSMFLHPMKESKTGVAEIDDCEPEIFRMFMLYLYTAKLPTLTLKNVGDLYILADKYLVEKLKSHCVRYIGQRLTTQNFCDFLALALRPGGTNLLNLVSNFLAGHMKDILITEKWITFLNENPSEANNLIVKALDKK